MSGLDRARDSAVLTHGWPSTFVELLPLVPFLTDPHAHGIDGPAFDVVILPFLVTGSPNGPVGWA